MAELPTPAQSQSCPVEMSAASPNKQEAGSPMAKLQLDLPLALAHEMKSTGRCSFDAHDRFSTFEQALVGEARESASPRERDIRRLKPSYRSPRDTDRYPPFATAAAKGAVAARLALATQAAQLNSPTTRTPYRAPSDHDFREPTSPIKWAPQAKGQDFQTKFVLPSNQDIRRRTARDQDGFFGAAPGEDVLSLPLSPPFRQQLQHQLQLAIKAQSARSPPKSSPAKPEFTSRVTHTSRKSANKALRLEIILDQEGLLPQIFCCSFLNVCHSGFIGCSIPRKLSSGITATAHVPELKVAKPAFLSRATHSCQTSSSAEKSNW